LISKKKRRSHASSLGEPNKSVLCFRVKESKIKRKNGWGGRERERERENLFIFKKELPKN
jgi:hypothetical protein